MDVNIVGKGVLETACKDYASTGAVLRGKLAVLYVVLTSNTRARFCLSGHLEACMGPKNYKDLQQEFVFLVNTASSAHTLAAHMHLKLRCNEKIFRSQNVTDN